MAFAEAKTVTTKLITLSMNEEEAGELYALVGATAGKNNLDEVYRQLGKVTLRRGVVSGSIRVDS